MEAGIHELTAGYALDALDPAEREEFERHLAGCEHVPGGARLLLGGHERARRGGGRPEAAARAARPDPRGGACGAADGRPVRAAAAACRRRALAAAAAIAAAVAIGLGIYAISLDRAGSTTPGPRSPRRRTSQPCSPTPNATTVPMAAGTGRLVVAGDGSAVLVLDELATVPAGKTYQAWVVEGKTPVPAGTFDERGGHAVVPIPPARAGRRRRGGDDRGRGRRKDADAADSRCFEARVALPVARNAGRLRRRTVTGVSPRSSRAPLPSLLGAHGTSLVRVRRSRPSSCIRTLVRWTCDRRCRELFGFDEFRPGQEEVVRAAVEGRDTLALMPTGSGKSLTYQLAAMLRARADARPLAAHRPDEGSGRQAAPPGSPRRRRSSTRRSTRTWRPDGSATSPRAGRGCSTRRRSGCATPRSSRRCGRSSVGLVVIDEVHCVSMWGHDFRPDYLFIRRALEALGEPSVLGMTATATPAVANEIASALGRELAVVRTSVVRPNLRYDVAGGGRQRGPTARARRAAASASAREARSCTPARATPASGWRGRSAATGSGSSTTTRASRRPSGPGCRTIS